MTLWLIPIGALIALAIIFALGSFKLAAQADARDECARKLAEGGR